MPAEQDSGFSPKVVWMVVGVLIVITAGIIAYIMLSGEGTEDSPAADQTSQSQSDQGEGGAEITGESEPVEADKISAVPYIAVGPDNNPHVVFYVVEDEDFRYCTRTGSGEDAEWSCENIETEGNKGDGHYIVVDSNGTVHTCYRDQTGGGMKYARKEAGGEWDMTTLDGPTSEDQSSESCSIATASNGDVHVAYAFQSTEEASFIKYIIWDEAGQEWGPPEKITEGHWPSLALDENDSPSFAYHSPMDGLVYFAWQEDGEWETEVVDSSTETEADPRMALDSDGSPHIMIRTSGSDGSIVYFSKSGSEWTSEELAAHIGGGDMQDMTIGPNGVPTVTYSTDVTLHLLQKIDGEWEEEEVCAGGVNMVAVDSLGHTHIAFTYLPDGDDDDLADDDGDYLVESEESVEGPAEFEEEYIYYILVE